MVVLRIEHSVQDFEMWKKQGFDSDPLDRQGSGVVSYRIYRPMDDPKNAMIDLEFTTANEANVMLSKLEKMWGNVKEQFGWDSLPSARIVDIIESKAY